MAEGGLAALSVEEFLRRLGGGDPTPKGGAASALAAALGASLVSMVCNLTIGRPRYAEYDAEARRVQALAELLGDRVRGYIDQDAAAYGAVIAAYQLPRATAEQKAARSDAIQEATLDAALVPLSVVEASEYLIDLAEQALGKTNPNAVSDLAVAAARGRGARRRGGQRRDQPLVPRGRAGTHAHRRAAGERAGGSARAGDADRGARTADDPAHGPSAASSEGRRWTSIRARAWASQRSRIVESSGSHVSSPGDGVVAFVVGRVRSASSAKRRSCAGSVGSVDVSVSTEATSRPVLDQMEAPRAAVEQPLEDQEPPAVREAGQLRGSSGELLDVAEGRAHPVDLGLVASACSRLHPGAEHRESVGAISAGEQRAGVEDGAALTSSPRRRANAQEFGRRATDTARRAALTLSNGPT